MVLLEERHNTVKKNFLNRSVLNGQKTMSENEAAMPQDSVRNETCMHQLSYRKQ